MSIALRDPRFFALQSLYAFPRTIYDLLVCFASHFQMNRRGDRKVSIVAWMALSFLLDLDGDAFDHNFEREIDFERNQF